MKKNPQNNIPDGNTERGKFYQFLLKHTATASMVADETGIAQKNICRYKRQLEDRSLLWPLKRAACRLTGCMAFYLTTNPKKASKDGKR